MVTILSMFLFQRAKKEVRFFKSSGPTHPSHFALYFSEQIQLIVGKTADPAILKKLTYIGEPRADPEMQPFGISQFVLADRVLSFEIISFDPPPQDPASRYLHCIPCRQQALCGGGCGHVARYPSP